MPARSGAWVLVASLLCVAVAGCGKSKPSDEDLIERFIADVTGAVDTTYADRVMAYVDFAAYPVDVQTPGHLGVYSLEQSDALMADFRRVVARLQGTKLKRRSSRVQIEDDSAQVELGLIGAFGPFDAQVRLHKHAQGLWRVTHVRLQN
jgi:hypothetical protein